MNISLLNNPRGANFRQFKSFQTLIMGFNVTQFAHSGDEINQGIHDFVATNFPNAVRDVYPYKESYIKSAIIHESLPNTERNRTLVDIADVVIAIPMLVFEFEDSPLMKTVNYAIARNKEVYLLSPKGNIYEVWSNKNA